MLTALTTAATCAIKLPTVATEGYINVGDAVVMFSAMLLGPWLGFVAGGVGSCLADLLSGYAHWILPTFLIKGIEGFVVGLLFRCLKKVCHNTYIVAAASCAVGAIEMAAGYFVASAIMKGSALVALTSLPANCLQGLVGLVLSSVLLAVAQKTRIAEKLELDFAKEERHSPVRNSKNATKKPTDANK